MPLPLYLAMTAAELSKCTALPSNFAYMACHFSPYTTGLSNLPATLPPNGMLILNDRIPVHRHDPERIANQLAAFMKTNPVSRLLLDFERPEDPLAKEIVSTLVKTNLCPTAVTEACADNVDCGVFLYVSPYETFSAAASRWQGRPIWLDVALDSCTITVTEAGATASSCEDHEEVFPFVHSELSVHYKTSVMQDHVRFCLKRTQDDIQHLLAQAEEFGAECAVGLYQQLGKK